jgi:hypothetical protein
MAKRKKHNRNLGPRRKRMRRPARLQAAIKWRAGYGGRNVVRGYARWFGVDLICALTELRMLGVAIDGEYEQAVRRSVAGKAEARARWRAAKLAKELAENARQREIEFLTGWIFDDDATRDPYDIPF